jgi:hypothetical protein
MPATIAAVLIVLWLLGFFAFHVTSGLVHVVLVDVIPSGDAVEPEGRLSLPDVYFFRFSNARVHSRPRFCASAI